MELSFSLILPRVGTSPAVILRIGFKVQSRALTRAAREGAPEAYAITLDDFQSEGEPKTLKDYSE
jgi:hypothetical protein